MAFVARTRVQQAQRLLVEENPPVHVVAERCGYRDPFHFSRRFKAATGLAPLAYRRSLRAWSGATTPPAVTPGG